MQQQKGISLAEFGRQVGVTGEYVRKALSQGKIPADCVKRVPTSSGGTRPVVIDPERAARYWGRTRDPNMIRDKSALSEGAKRGWQQRRETFGASGGNDRCGRQAARPRPVPAPASGIGADLLDGERESEDEMSYNDLRRITESFKAKTARVEYEKLIGKLVDAEAAAEDSLKLMTAVRNRLRGVPTEAKGRIPALTVADIEALEELIDTALNSAADQAFDEDADSGAPGDSEPGQCDEGEEE